MAEDKEEKLCTNTSSTVFVVILIAQICLQIIASVLYLLSSQFAPSIVTFCSICLCLLSLYAFIRNNFALIAVYIFLQPLYIAWNVFLLLLYLQIGPLTLPYDPPTELKKSDNFESSGDFASGDYDNDDEDLSELRQARNTPTYAGADTETSDPDAINWVKYLTLFTTDDKSFMLSHSSLQTIVYSGDDGFIGGEITVGRLLELVLLLLLILISSAGFIASIFAHRTVKSIGRQKYQSEFRYQSHNSAIQNAFATPRLEPSSRDHLLQNSCDRILQSHHSVSGAHSVHSYSAHPRHPHPQSNPYHQGSYHRDY